VVICQAFKPLHLRTIKGFWSFLKKS
jgi:hypothetical protein